jgi:biopolymer transport protein TolR
MAMQMGGKGLNSEINVTPLVDVMLVLLIIFMVVTPMLQRGKAVQLPQTRQPEKQPDEGKDIVVSVQWLKKGAGFGHKIYLGRDPVNEARLRTRLLDELRKDPAKSIYLKGDKRLDYGTVRQVMEVCHQAGFQQVKLATEELKTGEKG